MRLGATPEPINLDLRNQILDIIKAVRKTKAKVDARLAVVPVGRPNPFEQDQRDFSAWTDAFSLSDPLVTALERRLSSGTGPYWMDLTQDEKDALDIWKQSVGNLDDITYRHYPTRSEMDIKKVILAVVGIGAIVAPLFLTESKDTGLPFQDAFKIPGIPEGRAPLQAARPVGSPLGPQMPSEAFVGTGPVQGTVARSASSRSTPGRGLSKFTRSFAPVPEGAQAPARAAGGFSRREPIQRRMVNPGEDE